MVVLLWTNIYVNERTYESPNTPRVLESNVIHVLICRYVSHNPHTHLQSTYNVAYRELVY